MSDQVQRIKGNIGKAPWEHIIPKDIDEILSVDLFGPMTKSTKGNAHVFGTVDLFSKLVQFYPCQKINGEALVNIIKEKQVPKIGKPKTILTDRSGLMS